jgi:hypothetical protein
MSVAGVVYCPRDTRLERDVCTAGDNHPGAQKLAREALDGFLVLSTPNVAVPFFKVGRDSFPRIEMVEYRLFLGHWSSDIFTLPEEKGMPVIWLAALLLGTGFALATGRDVKGKVVNVVIVLGCMGVGLGVGYVVGLGRGNMGMIPNAGMPFAMMFGVLGAMVCVAKDTWERND